MFFLNAFSQKVYVNDSLKTKYTGKEAYFFIDEMPRFNNYKDEDALIQFRSWVSNQIEYLPEWQEEGIEGKEIVQFIINEQGDLTDINIIKSIHPLIDEEVKRILETSPKWIPGEQDGKLIKIQYTMPITFSLPKPRLSLPE